MQWTYKQSTGEMLRPDGSSFGYGFAGRGLGFNNPKAQDMHGVGPLPQSSYKINTWIGKHPTMGLCVIQLEPVYPKDLYGRSGFYIHGAVSLDTHGAQAFLTSSEGCIVFRDCAARQAIWSTSPGGLLQVVA